MPSWTLQVAPATAWLFLAILAEVDGFALSAAFAMLVAFPLALRIDEDVPLWLRRAAAGIGLLATTALLLPVGPGAGAVAALWLLVTIPHLAYGFVRFLSNPRPRLPFAWAEAAASVGPVVSSVALITSRSLGTFAGFPEPLATLTVTHFHFTFGLLPLALSALARRGFAATTPLWALVFVPPVVGALMATRSDVMRPSLLEGGAAAILALSALAWTVGSWAPLGGLPGLARWTGRGAAVLFSAAVALTPIFATTHALGSPRLDFAAMLRDHGSSLAIALTALGALAARYAPLRGITSTVPTIDAVAAPTDIAEERALFRDCRVCDLGPAAGGRFERLADALLAYRFYPDSVMCSTSSFGAEDRPARVGDRIGMCLLVALFPGMPAVRFPATTVVNLAERREGFAAFGYLTTQAHYGRGGWSATLEAQGERVILTLRSRMTPTHPLAVLGLPAYRWFQKRAHAAGIARLGATP
ncbi:hypothetical protein LBMAG42_54670 [Deltaproteobacteria bacterium]|nr:hypothetical protein LBMAG42_54670 [Deltaproteobacteria bacterium]